MDRKSSNRQISDQIYPLPELSDGCKKLAATWLKFHPHNVGKVDTTQIHSSLKFDKSEYANLVCPLVPVLPDAASLLFSNEIQLNFHLVGITNAYPRS